MAITPQGLQKLGFSSDTVFIILIWSSPTDMLSDPRGFEGTNPSTYNAVSLPIIYTFGNCPLTDAI